MKKATLLFFAVLLAVPAWSDSLLFVGANGTHSASALFTLTGNNLTLELKNTSSSDVLVPTDVLTGVFFNTTDQLTPVSVSLNGSSTRYGSVTNNPGEGWQFKSGVTIDGKNSGVSATGLGVFGPAGNFWVDGLQLGGLNYGILSVGDNPLTGNTGVTKSGPLFQSALLFTFQASPAFMLSELGNNVVFQFGTATDEPSFTGTTQTPNLPTTPVPEPSTIGLFAAGFTGLAIFRKLSK